VAARRGVWLVVTLILVAVLVSAGGLAFTLFLMGRQPVLVSDSTLVLRLSGDLPEHEPGGFPSLLRDQPTLRGVIDALRRATTDRRVKGVVFVPTPSPMLWGKTQELRDALLEFRRSGKPLSAYLEYAGNREYYLASACSKVYLIPTGTLNLNGLASYEVFLRGTLDKLGVYPDLLHIGDYKTAVNTFTEKGFTPAHREMATSLNADAFEQLVAGIAEHRRMSPDTVRALIDEAPMLPGDALKHGLVDDVLYFDQVAAQTGGRSPRLVEYARYAGDGASSLTGWRRGAKVALIYAVGTITGGESTRTTVGADTLTNFIRRAREDRDVKAVVLRIDSPGGSSVASDAMWRELMLTRNAKPVVASMSDLAASGGYYIAMPAHVIVAQPGTLTGSIGIFSGKFVMGGFFQKLGATVDSVSEGHYAELESPTRRFTPEERAKVEEQMQAFYDQFVEKAAQSRKSTPERIDAVAQGRVWTGRQAKDIGLVDELGGLSRALAIARKRAGLAADVDVPIVVYPPRKSFYESLTDPLSETGAGRSLLLEALLSPAERHAVASVRASLQLLRAGEPLALMPYVFLRK
jgi:protease-4